ncbi:hypothetical protein F2P81_010900 [Scophthalmus maximus]|uniref:Uncharacterized protein n=1 Tax=Scophthalmus maximus TaxID=52904 RepID=A0A6A4SS50_SCOMX|nr:hypothetical protein F2P81_010900 [Scophthalmus maximus]
MDDFTPVDKPQSSTPDATNSNTLEQLGDLLGELATQIDDAVSLKTEDDLSSVYEESCKSAQSDSIIVCQNIHFLENALFFTDVLVNDKVVLQGMLDSDSMACTMSEVDEEELHKAGLLSESTQTKKDIVLVGCGGVKVQPKCIYQLKLRIYEQELIVPTLVVPSQRDQMIVDTNVLNYLLDQLKQDPSYWCVMNKASSPVPGELLPRFLRYLRYCKKTSTIEFSECLDRLGMVVSVTVTTLPTLQNRLSNLGLGEININSCEVSPYWNGQLVDLIQQYEDLFSKDKLDCGNA